MQQSIKLAIVDDQHLFRTGLISLLNEFHEMKVVIEASNGKDLICQLEKQVPDVILLDIEMPQMDGFETTKYLKKHYPDIKILILTMYDEEYLILNLVENGAHGFLLKNNNIETIVSAIHMVIKKEYYYNNSVSMSMVKELMGNKMIKSDDKKMNLSKREIEITKMICKEYTNKEISEKLFISIKTVDGHREKILSKTKARNTAGIVIYAIKNKLMMLSRLKK